MSGWEMSGYPAPYNHPGQDVCVHVPLSPSSILWYQHKLVSDKYWNVLAASTCAEPLYSSVASSRVEWISCSPTRQLYFIFWLQQLLLSINWKQSQLTRFSYFQLRCLRATRSILLTGHPNASFCSLKTTLFSLGLSHWKRFWLVCIARGAI